MTEPGKRQLIISKGWIQGALLTFVIGFFVLGFIAYRTYDGKSPIPDEVRSPAGELLYTADDVHRGQAVFLENGLMEYGSVFGHGAYLGPDYTADALHLAAADVVGQYGGAESDAARRRAVEDFQTNRFDQASGSLEYTDAQAIAFRNLVTYYGEFFGDPSTSHGLRKEAITDPEDIRQLTAFFSWSAWTAAALRPGHDYSYTNNWPPEDLVDNGPTANTIMWSALSFIALIGGIGILLTVLGRWTLLGWQGRDQRTLAFRRPGDVALTPSQKAVAYFIFIMAALFLVQTLVGGAAQHYRSDIESFFGLDLASIFPYNVVRTWHVQLAVFVVSTSFLASGIFIAPMIAGREPKGQHILSYALLGALAIVVIGSLLMEAFGIFGFLGTVTHWFGLQGFEYLDLGRVWQILLIVGLVLWIVILFRGLRPRLRRESLGNMPWLFFFAALAIPVVYAFGLLARPTEHFTITEFWRFWVVHLWVENFLELFTTVMVAYIFVLLGVVRERVAMAMIYLDIILYSAGGIIGTAHHMYFNGEPAEGMALGAFFSAIEVVPLTFLTIEAWTFIQFGAKQRSTMTPFPHRWAVMFLVAVGFWNFLGAGIFGFLINTPIVSYFEIGTALTPNHGHAAFMGVYGMMAVGLALFCLRYLIPDERWSDRAAKTSFWSLNIGLAWMCFATLLPLGLIQLYESVRNGYYSARSLDFLTNSTNTVIEWLRFPGDILFIVGGVLPLLYLSFLGIRYRVKRTTMVEPDEILVSEADAREHLAKQKA